VIQGNKPTEKPTEIVEKILEELPEKFDEVLDDLKPEKSDETVEDLKPEKAKEILENPISRFPNQQDPARKVVRVVKRPKTGPKSRPVNLNQGRKLGITLHPVFTPQDPQLKKDLSNFF
jgi:hypothetical protein